MAESSSMDRVEESVQVMPAFFIMRSAVAISLRQFSSEAYKLSGRRSLRTECKRSGLNGEAKNFVSMRDQCGRQSAAREILWN